MSIPSKVKQSIIDNMYYFNIGQHYTCYEFLGAKRSTEKGKAGYRFTVWAPNAKNVELLGSFSNWSLIQMESIEQTGAWSVFVANAEEWDLYKYMIESHDGIKKEKQDPMSLAYEIPPQTASVIQDIPEMTWTDQEWQKQRQESNQYLQPMNVYEVHAGSWRRHEDGSSYTIAELKDTLIPYVKEMGYTHIEFMPLTDHPLEASWGYQVTGFFSIAGRFGHDIGPLQDFVNEAHRQGIGVILDWVPGHFNRNDYALPYFDGTATYEYEDANRANNIGWGTYNFDLGKPQVQSFLISSAVYWWKTYRLDGFRIDAVSSMLYLDFDIGPWTANDDGSNENRQGIEFLRKLNRELFLRDPNIKMIAEESSSWAMVTKPLEHGGLGFNYKWNMGWMNDILEFFEMDPLFRSDNFNLVTFSFMYTFNENFVLPISHDEVVHGKKSMLEKMYKPSGDRYRQFAHLRAFYGYMISHPGKKLNFMGNEIGQYLEWREYDQVEWNVLDLEYNAEYQHYMKTINHLYKDEKALHEFDFNPKGLKIIDADNRDDSVLSFIRRAEDPEDFLIILVNFTPVQRDHFQIGVPDAGTYTALLNSERVEFGGTWTGDHGVLETKEGQRNHQNQYLEMVLPALSCTILKPLEIVKDQANKKALAIVAKEKPVTNDKKEEKKDEAVAKKKTKNGSRRKRG